MGIFINPQLICNNFITFFDKNEFWKYNINYEESDFSVFIFCIIK